MPFLMHYYYYLFDTIFLLFTSHLHGHGVTTFNIVTVQTNVQGLLQQHMYAQIKLLTILTSGLAV